VWHGLRPSGWDMHNTVIKHMVTIFKGGKVDALHCADGSIDNAACNIKVVSDHNGHSDGQGETFESSASVARMQAVGDVEDGRVCDR
jgi:hypothetical protein